MINVVFHKNGKWTKQEFAKQCSENVAFGDNCQGAEGHEGDHWCYGPDGCYHFELQNWRQLKGHEIAGGSTPPDHDEYVHPKDKVKDYYMSNYTVTDVTDPEEIARLERGEIREGETIDRPVDDEEEIGRGVEDK
jgi:hypothetical protein